MKSVTLTATAAAVLSAFQQIGGNPTKVPDQLLKSFRLEGKIGPNWTTIAEVSDNR